MFDKQFVLLQQLNSSIKDNRAIYNYLITGVLVFSGFILGPGNEIPILRLILVGIFLLTILIQWVHAYGLTTANVGLNTNECCSAAYQVNSKGNPYFDSAEEYWLHMVGQINNIYSNQKSKIDNMNNKRTVMQYWTIAYIIFVLLIAVIPSINISFSSATFIL